MTTLFDSYDYYEPHKRPSLTEINKHLARAQWTWLRSIRMCGLTPPLVVWMPTQWWRTFW